MLIIPNIDVPRLLAALALGLVLSSGGFAETVTVPGIRLGTRFIECTLYGDTAFTIPDGWTVTDDRTTEESVAVACIHQGHIFACPNHSIPVMVRRIQLQRPETLEAFFSPSQHCRFVKYEPPQEKE